MDDPFLPRTDPVALIWRWLGIAMILVIIVGALVPNYHPDTVKTVFMLILAAAMVVASFFVKRKPSRGISPSLDSDLELTVQGGSPQGLYRKKSSPDLLALVCLVSEIILGMIGKEGFSLFTIILAIAVGIFYTWRRRDTISKMPYMWPANLPYYLGMPFMAFIAWMFGVFIMIVISSVMKVGVATR
jgi:hypothetical protein